MFVRLRHLLRWIISVFRSREELLLENLALRQQLLALHAKRPRPRLSFRRQTVLGRFARSLVRLEEIVDPRHPGDRGSLAPDRLSAVLELDLARSKGGRKKTYQQGSARADLSDGR